jgi:alcohol dehydrogenase
MENIDAFNNHLPVKVRFGEGKALGLADVVAEFGATKVFLMVDDATNALTKSGAQVLVALSGGSVIDTAKAARLCSQLGMSFRDFQSKKPAYPEPTVALIALPTSAGTT